MKNYSVILIVHTNPENVLETKDVFLEVKATDPNKALSEAKLNVSYPVFSSAVFPIQKSISKI